MRRMVAVFCCRGASTRLRREASAWQAERGGYRRAREDRLPYNYPLRRGQRPRQRAPRIPYSKSLPALQLREDLANKLF
jgi:hypothetical protein